MFTPTFPSPAELPELHKGKFQQQKPPQAFPDMNFSVQESLAADSLPIPSISISLPFHFNGLLNSPGLSVSTFPCLHLAR